MRFFVTGGSRGLGASIVAHAVETGHDVAFAYKSSREAAEKVVEAAVAARPGCRCVGYELDVRDPAAVEAVGERVVDEMEGVDVVVNCAGVNRDNLLVSMSDKEWDDVISTNLSGPFYVIRQFMPSMLANRFGRIVNISSIQHRGAKGQCNYAASKAGLHGLTLSVAKEYGRKGVTANVIAPGFFDTDMTRASLHDEARQYWQQHCPSPKGRMGQPSEIAQTVLFLASDGAGYINGQVIHVAGGLDWLP